MAMFGNGAWTQPEQISLSSSKTALPEDQTRTPRWETGEFYGAVAMMSTTVVVDQPIEEPTLHLLFSKIGGLESL